MNSSRKAEIVRDVYRTLRAGGWNHIHTCGMLGNIEQECHFDTEILGFDGTGSCGLCQWLDSKWEKRLTNLKRFAQLKGADWRNHIVQAEFILHELETTQRAAAIYLRASQTPGHAALMFSKHYERPAAAHAHNDKRQRYAERFYRELANEL